MTCQNLEQTAYWSKIVKNWFNCHIWSQLSIKVRLHNDATEPIAHTVNRTYSAASSAPLYESHYFGLDKLGLTDEEFDSLSETSSSQTDYFSKERITSAPIKKSQKIFKDKFVRPKSCFPLLCL